MGLSLSIKMNGERFPTSGADDSAEITVRLTRAELLALDRFCAEKRLDPQPGRAPRFESASSSSEPIGREE